MERAKKTTLPVTRMRTPTSQPTRHDSEEGDLSFDLSSPYGKKPEVPVSSGPSADDIQRTDRAFGAAIVKEFANYCKYRCDTNTIDIVYLDQGDTSIVFPVRKFVPRLANVPVDKADEIWKRAVHATWLNEGFSGDKAERPVYKDLTFCFNVQKNASIIQQCTEARAVIKAFLDKVYKRTRDLANVMEVFQFTSYFEMDVYQEEDMELNLTFGGDVDLIMAPGIYGCGVFLYYFLHDYPDADWEQARRFYTVYLNAMLYEFLRDFRLVK